MIEADAERLMQDFQNEILEMIAYGEPLEIVADVLCHRAEQLSPSIHCSILRVDNGTLRSLSGPSLPTHFSRAVDGLRIGPAVGSCGTAAFRNEPVEVTDIAKDPLWTDYKALALPIGLRACWSSPIRARDGRVTGTFAFYFREPRAPTPFERGIVSTFAHLCAIAIEQAQVHARNHHLAHFDVLTGLPNRVSFNARMAASVGAGAPFALLLVDIDHLKTTNDTMGHAIGDALIRTVGERLRDSGPLRTVFRLGGDEFAVLIEDCADEKTMRGIAGDMTDLANRPFRQGDCLLTPSISAGGVIFGQDGVDVDTLCQNADFALYHAKESERGGFVPFRKGMRSSIIHRLRTIADVSDALSEDRIVPHYQPIVRLDTAEIVGLEALARMRTRDGAVLSAGQFFQALSDPRVGYDLTTRMLQQVAADIRVWLDLGISFQHVGINATTADFQKGDLEQRITQAFGQVGVPLHHVILEVTEAVFMGGSDNSVARAVEGLRRKGMRVALDDFGTGFASLTHLLDFPVDVIKIDKSFVDRLVDDHQSEAIVAALIDLSAKLDMKLVAEGIETAAQAERLVALGCRLGQGYHFARPADAAIATELLQSFAQKAPAAATRRTA